MKAPKFIETEARALFDILAPFGGVHLVAIHHKAPAIYGKQFGNRIDEALVWAQKLNAEGFGIYWSVNAVRPLRDRKPSKADISHARFVHVDIDPPKTGGKFDKPEIIAALSGLATPPSFVIDSGGGLNAFWRLDIPCENLASIEAINRQVQDFYGADACWNIDRVMRVPGTVNWPNAVKRSRGRGESQATWAAHNDGLLFEPQELASAFPEARLVAPARGAVAMPENIEPLTPDALGLSSLDPVRLAVSSPPGVDRSGDGVAAARLMVNAGMTDAQIIGVLLNSENAVSAHYLDQRDSLRAAARTLQLVRADGPPSPDVVPPPMSAADHKRLVENMKRKAAAKAKTDMKLEPLKEQRRAGPKDPAWLSELGDGGLARWVRYVTSTAPSPQPWVTLGAGIAMFGAIAGRRYASPTDLRTNIYSIGICDSGGGKDHPLKCVMELMTEAGLHTHMGGSKIASGPAMITDLTRSLNLIYPLDEIGFLLAGASDRSRGTTHLTAILDNLTEFYSMARSTFMGTSYADQSDKGKPRQVISQPCLSLFGVTTPNVFWGSLSSANVLDGSLARMLIFESDNNYPDANHDALMAPPPEDLIELAQAIDQGAEGHQCFPLGQSASVKPNPYQVPYADEEAQIQARQYRDNQTAMLREHEGTNLTGIIARMAENAAKLALIKAITDNPARPAITIADLHWGMGVARRSVETLMLAVRKKVADNVYEADLKFIHQCIIDAGSAGLSSTELSKVAKKVKARDRKEILAHLDEARMIRIETTEGAKTGPKPFICYDIS